MVTGASTADVAVILVDARKGICTQTRRHSFLVSLLGIRHVVVVINKMDLVGYSRGHSTRSARTAQLAARIGLTDITFIPLSALKGDNVVAAAPIPVVSRPDADGLSRNGRDRRRGDAGPFRMPVQWVNRPNHNFRGFSGRVVGGRFRPGDAVRVMPAGTTSRVARIVDVRR